MEWFSKNWWVVLILGLVAVGVWWFLNKEEAPRITLTDECKGHEAKIKEEIDRINADTDLKVKYENQINEAEHPCGKRALTKEQCIRLNAIYALKLAGRIPQNCDLN